MRYSVKYALAGGVLSLGAPAGLLLTRVRPPGDVRAALGCYAGELKRDPASFVYVTVSTLAVFTGFGAFLGHMIDSYVELADREPLTRLATRRKFWQDLQYATERAKRYEESVSLLMIDVDRLKVINDTLGHRSGDRALTYVGRCISRALRTTDRAARIGGDEFAVIAPTIGECDAVALATRLCELVCRETPPAAPPVTVSVGVCTARPAAQTPTGVAIDELLSAADAALYDAKHAGGNAVSAGRPPG